MNRSIQRNPWLALAILALALLACNLPTTGQVSPTSQPTVPVTTEAVEDLEASLEQAVQVAAANQQVSIVITEEQLTSLIAFEIQKQNQVDIQNPQVYLRDGQIQLQGDLRQSGISAPLKIAFSVGVDANGQPTYDVVSASIGPLPLPDALLNQLTGQVDQIMAGQLASNEVVIESLTIADGVMSITGHKR